MKDAIENAREELKRVDHLIYVSLKYTRTCDIFKSIIDRLINSIDFTMEAVLKKMEEEHKILEIPAQPGMKCSTIKENSEDEKVIGILDFYLLLRQMSRADFTRAREYRRHVTMTMTIDGAMHEITIDNITQYYKDTKEYVDYIEIMLGLVAR